MDLIEKLKWRYATKKMNASKIVPQEKIERILEAIRLTPTSSGLQPYEVFVVTNAALRAKIMPIAWNQGQVVDCSHLLIFAAWDTYTPQRINMMFDLAKAERGLTGPAAEGWDDYRKKLLAEYPQRSAEANFNHAAKQAYIALGIAMVAAAEEGVDATPMEGFDPAALDRLLELSQRGLKSVLMLPLGYREADRDWLVNLKKVRRPREQFITEIK